MCTACDDGLMVGSDIRSSWIVNSSGRLVPVQYTNVDSRAIFEGCIILGRTRDLEKVRGAVADDPALITDPRGVQTQGLAIKGAGFRWEGGEIPYIIDSSLAAPDRTQIVLDAIAHWHEHTPIRLRERRSDDDYVRFIDGNGCAASVGRQGGEQEIILGAGCTTGNAIHEIGHTVGLWHEQGRADRDEHIEIVWSNIQPRARHNFSQHTEDGEQLGAYDPGSIMHYGSRFFAVDPKKDTIRTKKAGVVIGQRLRLSEGDIAAVKAMYT